MKIDHLCAYCKWYEYTPATLWEPSDDYCSVPTGDCDCYDEDGEPIQKCKYFEHVDDYPDPEYMRHSIEEYSNVKPYAEFTAEEQEKHRQIWRQYLDEYCPAIDDEQSRPCDIGSLCDRCQFDYEFNLKVTRAYIKAGLPITPEVQFRYAKEEF